VFGHFGDRIGRKATLVAALLTMGLSTVVIGLLPTYASIGTLAPLLLALCRFGQGLGLGGEWGGAVLLATENAPPGKRAWYGMFPQLGAPIGFFLSGGIFLLLSQTLSDAEFFAWGWRIPFLASALLVLVGLYVRLKITRRPDFQAVLDRANASRCRSRPCSRTMARAACWARWMALSTFVVFYLMTVFALSWGTTGAGLFAPPSSCCCSWAPIVFFGLTIPPSAVLADRFGRRRDDRRVGRDHGPVRPAVRAAVRSGHDLVHGRAVPGAGPVPDRPDLRPARHAAVGTVPGRGALHGRVADLQPGRHPGRLAGAVCGNLAGEPTTACRPWAGI
jgi:hypothetical protein